jgi:hypothetical protein
MFEPKRILCSIDFSELADLALKYASVAAREYNATLHILHAETFDLLKSMQAEYHKQFFLCHKITILT